MSQTQTLKPSKTCNEPSKPTTDAPKSLSTTTTTGAIARSHSNDANERHLDEVLHELQKEKNIKIFESKQMTQKRQRIIKAVEELTTKWIQDCLAKNDSLPQCQIEKSSSYICSFGSFELNVHFESSDIDLLCIGPKFITRDMLFTEFVDMLETDQRVTDILQLRHAFVPLLKFTFEGIDIDLVYAQWNVDIIEEINVFSSKFIKDQDTLFSLNGVRATQTIKKLIPNPCIFEKTLRIIKFWAQQRAIYSNVMGFLGGISWSIMTALICIQHPNAINCVQIIKEFFAKYKDYDDYQMSSICLDHALYDNMYDDHKTDEDEIPSTDFIEYTRNEFTEIMPILTPARPAMNCAYNVIESTKALIIKELARGYDITHDDHASCMDWSKLFRARHLVNHEEEYDHASAVYDDENVYIRIQCIPDPSSTYCKKWTRFIESKIRNLVKKLNRELFDSTFYPYSTSIKHCNTDNFFIAGRYNIDFDHRQNNEDTINMALQQFQHQIDTSSVRFDCGLKCQLKLDVYHHTEIYAVLSKLQTDATSNDAVSDNTTNTMNPPIVNNAAAATALYSQYNLLQHIYNMTNNANANNRFHQPHAPQAAPRTPHHHHHHHHNHHNNNNRRHHHHRHQHHHQPPRHQHRRNSHRGTRYNNNAFIPTVYAPQAPPRLAASSVKSQTNTSDAIESADAQATVVVNANDDEDRNKVMDEETDSNESMTSSSDTHESLYLNPSNQNNNNLMSFQVPNLSNISSFPIIKIQQQGLPHLPPFVSAQTGPSSNEHYPFITNPNANASNNSSGWIHKMLLDNNNNNNNNGNENNSDYHHHNNKPKPAPQTNDKLANKEIIQECVFDDKENINVNIPKIIPKGNFIPHKRVKIPDAFVSDLNVMESEQFGYPVAHKASKCTNNVKNGHCDKSTLIIHPAVALNINNNNNNNTNNVKNNANSNNTTRANVTKINNHNNVTKINHHNNVTNNVNISNNINVNINNNVNTANENILKTVFLQQALAQNTASFNNSNSELIKSYQNYRNILNVCKIPDDNNYNSTVNNTNAPIPKTTNTAAAVAAALPVISIGYPSSSSRSSTTPSPHRSPSPDKLVSNQSNDERTHCKSSSLNTKKPLYSVITATAPTITTNRASVISLSSNTRYKEQHNASNYDNLPQRNKKRWHQTNNYHQHNHYNKNISNNNDYWNCSNEVVAPAPPFSRFNNNGNSNTHQSNNYNNYYNESNKWRLKPNKGYRSNYTQTQRKRTYYNQHHQRTLF